MSAPTTFPTCRIAGPTDAAVAAAAATMTTRGNGVAAGPNYGAINLPHPSIFIRFLSDCRSDDDLPTS